MARTLLVRGMLVGLVAGLAALVVAYVFGEPQVAAAIGIEEARAVVGEATEPEPVSRAVQATVGLGLAILVFGAAVGGIFGLAFGFAYGRLGRLGARATALVVAGIAFVAVALVPVLKYPPNPPGVASPMAMTGRTGLYFLMVLIAVVAAIGALIVGRSLVARWGAWNGVTATVLGYVVVVGAIAAVLPAMPADIEGFPADLLWRFRIASLAIDATLWATLGLVFGALTERAERRASPVRPLEPVA